MFIIYLFYRLSDEVIFHLNYKLIFEFDDQHVKHTILSVRDGTKARIRTLRLKKGPSRNSRHEK